MVHTLVPDFPYVFLKIVFQFQANRIPNIAHAVHGPPRVSSKAAYFAICCASIRLQDSPDGVPVTAGNDFPIILQTNVTLAQYVAVSLLYMFINWKIRSYSKQRKISTNQR